MPNLYFETHGYLIFKNAFDPKRSPAIHAEFKRLHQDFDSLKAQHPLLHKLGEWSIRSPQLASPEIEELVFSKEFAQICAELIGENVDLYWCATAAKPPGKGKAFPWHQDSGYGQGPDNYVTIWAAFDEVDETNGCLWVIPGSHREGLFEHEFRKSNDSDYAGPFMKSDHPRLSEKVPIRLSPGDVVCMHSKLVHSSLPNHSNRPRRGLIVAFIRPGSYDLKTVVGTPEAMTPYSRSGELVDRSSVRVSSVDA